VWLLGSFAVLSLLDRTPAAGVGASYGRALLAEFQTDPTLADQANGRRPGPGVGER
jgi:hypothetical protein